MVLDFTTHHKSSYECDAALGEISDFFYWLGVGKDHLDFYYIVNPYDRAV